MWETLLHQLAAEVAEIDVTSATDEAKKEKRRVAMNGAWCMAKYHKYSMVSQSID